MGRDAINRAERRVPTRARRAVVALPLALVLLPSAAAADPIFPSFGGLIDPFVTDPGHDAGWRSFNGTDHPTDSSLGAANTPLARLQGQLHPAFPGVGTFSGDPTYDDGIQDLYDNGGTRPNPRGVSNALSQQSGAMPNAKGLSAFVWTWGQFLDHDISLTPDRHPATDPGDTAPITVPAGDPVFGEGEIIPFIRSVTIPGTGTDPTNPIRHPNVITSYIDASNVYGLQSPPTGTATNADLLRAKDGSGRLMTSADGLYLPTGADLGLPDDPATPFDERALFVAGDVRVNEQLGLMSMHTLFMQEHNRLADRIRSDYPITLFPDAGFADLDEKLMFYDEMVYQTARKIVGAELQAITYNEFLPAVFGDAPLPAYTGFLPDVDPSVLSAFSGAVYRWHTLVNNEHHVYDDDGNLVVKDLAVCFFNPSCLENDDYGLAGVLQGLGEMPAQERDLGVVEGLRSMLFGANLDLVAFNIQRGRDFGLPGYGDVRGAFGLSDDPPIGDLTLLGLLQSLYGDLDEVDLWVGALAEDMAGESLFGELSTLILKIQFARLRDGDPKFYLAEGMFDEETLAWLNDLTLAKVIQWNTGWNEVAGNVFFMASVPEAGTAALLGFGLAALAVPMFRTRQKLRRG